MRILAIDPGKTTGWVLHTLEETPDFPLDVSGGQLGPEEHHEALWELLAAHDPDVIVCEEFTYRIIKNRGVDMPGIVLDSKEYIGIVKLWVEMVSPLRPQRVELHLPMPAAAVGDQKKIFWNDERLKLYGVYTKGEPHRNDATRHLLTHIVEKRKCRIYLRGLR